MGLTVNGHPAFLHDFQKGSLCLTGSTVDLICQKKVAHDSSRTVDKCSCFFLVHGKTCHIRGNHVRCKLDTLKIHTHQPAQCKSCGRLSYSRHIFQQYMSLCQNRHDDLVCNFFFSFNDRPQLFLKNPDLICHLLFPSSVICHIVKTVFSVFEPFIRNQCTKCLVGCHSIGFSI